MSGVATVGADLLARIEDASLNASAPPQQLWLDGWLVRLCPGEAKRARSVNPVAIGRRPLAEKLAETEALYREAGLPLILRLTPFTQPADIDHQLAAQGFQAFDRSWVMVRRLDPSAPLAPARPELTLSAVSPQEFSETVGSWHGTPSEHRQAHVRRLLGSPVPYTGFVVRREGEALACGQFTVEGELAGLYDVFTAPAARGQGVARWLCARLLDEALARGARTAYLQVDAENAAARAVYHRLGFADGYTYHYRSRDPAAA